MTSDELDALIGGIDAGVQAHLAWNHRLLRCALLRESPGDDMLRPEAHTICRFGVWLARERAALEAFDASLTAAIEDSHAAMHQAVRSLCAHNLRGEAAAPSTLKAYEEGQRAMLARLSELRHAMVHASARNDPLTGLPLRHGMPTAFEHCTKDARREGALLFVAMIDIDRFKSVNDSWGHPVGDAALQHVAACLRATLRDNDPLFRFGGEEFLALLRCPDAAAAQDTARRLLQGLRLAPLTVLPGVVLRLTATIGLAEAGANETFESVVARADHALLQGKLHGRDRHVVAGPAPQDGG